MSTGYNITTKLSLLLLILTGLFYCADTSAQWEREYCPVRNNLNSVFFINNSTGWIVGDAGSILKKTGDGWAIFPKPTGNDLYSVHMIREDDVWAVGARGTIIHFDGNTWKTIDSPTGNNLYSVSFKDSQNGIAVGDYGTILNFRDGLWTSARGVNKSKLLAVSFDKDSPWIGGGLECVNVPIMKIAITKGERTIVKSFDSYALINSMKFLNQDNGWAAGSPSTLLHFDGQQWAPADIHVNFSSLSSIFFTDENNGISVGNAGTILVYKEGSWTKENSSISKNLRGCYKTGTSYYAVGEGGTILSRTTGENYPRTFLTEQVSGDIKLYPDPCDDILNILLEGGDPRTTRVVTVSNVSGQVLLNQTLISVSGSFFSKVSTATLQDGLYFLKIAEGNRISSRRFVVKH